MAAGGYRPGAGRKKGKKLPKTIEREAARTQLQQMVLQRLKPIFEHQYSLVQGISYLYRIDEGPNGGKEHVIVEDKDEIGDILAQMHDSNGELVDGVYNDKYYYITVKPPENKAIDSLLDRVFGKSPQALTGEKGGPIEVTITKYAAKPAPPLRT